MPSLSQPRSISTPGLNFIKGFEQLRLTVYPDQAGRPTIGFGHLLTSGEAFPGGITNAQAFAILAKDLELAERSILYLVCNQGRADAVTLAQYEFDALVSLVFNIGAGPFRDSTLLKKLRVADRAGAADEFPRWDKEHRNGVLFESAGLRRRRDAERQVFLGQAVKEYA